MYGFPSLAANGTVGDPSATQGLRRVVDSAPTRALRGTHMPLSASPHLSGIFLSHGPPAPLCEQGCACTADAERLQAAAATRALASRKAAEKIEAAGYRAALAALDARASEVRASHATVEEMQTARGRAAADLRYAENAAEQWREGCARIPEAVAEIAGHIAYLRGGAR